MNFQEKSAKKKEQIEGNLPPHIVKTMHQATTSLQNSGILNKDLKSLT